MAMSDAIKLFISKTGKHITKAHKYHKEPIADLHTRTKRKLKHPISEKSELF